MNGFCHKRGQGFKHRQYTPTESFLNAPPPPPAGYLEDFEQYVSMYLRKLESLTDRAY